MEKEGRINILLTGSAVDTLYTHWSKRSISNKVTCHLKMLQYSWCSHRLYFHTCFNPASWAGAFALHKVDALSVPSKLGRLNVTPLLLPPVCGFASSIGWWFVCVCLECLSSHRHSLDNAYLILRSSEIFIKLVLPGFFFFTAVVSFKFTLHYDDDNKKTTTCSNFLLTSLSMVKLCVCERACVLSVRIYCYLPLSPTNCILYSWLSGVKRGEPGHVLEFPDNDSLLIP